MPRCSVEGILRVIIDLVDEEYRRERGASLTEHPSWNPEEPQALSLGNEGLSFDSVQLLTAAGAVNAFFRLHETGVEDYLLRRRTLEQWAQIVAHALSEGTSGVTFRTSGSTGTPKQIGHSWESLEQEIAFLARLFAGRRRVLATVPSHHIYGFLFTVLLPQALEAEVKRYRWQELGSLSGEAEPGDLIVSQPTLWRYLATSVGSWGEDLRGVSSTAPLPAQTMEAHYRLGMLRLTEVYGSTETGGVGYREEPDGAFALFPYLRKAPAGATHAAGGVGGGDGGAELLRENRQGESEPVELLDNLEWVDERHFRPRGRRDRVVQIGGVNVDLSTVEQEIAAHPAVGEVVVRANSDSREGRLKAFIVPVAEVSAEELEDLCRRRLEPAHRPLSFTFGQALPRNSLGKITDWPV